MGINFPSDVFILNKVFVMQKFQNTKIKNVCNNMYFSIIEDKKPRQSLTHVAAADHIPMNYGNAYSKAKAFEVSLTRFNKYSVFLN